MRIRLARALGGAAALLLALLPPAGPARAAGRAARAESLFRQAELEIARNTIDDRRMAIRDLEQATLLDPASALYELELARAYYTAGFLSNARRRYERVTRLAPADANGRYGLGQVWRRDWLKYLDRTSLDRAVEHLSFAARLKPDFCDAWLLLAPLLAERGDDRAAAAAAQRALAADPGRADALLAAGYTAYRLGNLERADSAFAAAMPRLRRGVRGRFEDIAPVASERDTAILNHLPPAQQAEYRGRFWRENDPDLATPVNEARLEYWARVAHAYFLFYDLRRHEWDERGEVYVRYGAPDSVSYNPVEAMVRNTAAGDRSHANVVLYGTGPAYPANSQLWVYRDLGMEVLMQDRTLNEIYRLPMTEDFDPDPAPDPDSLARHGEALATSGGRGVFHHLPPGVRPLPAAGTIARFEGGVSPRLLAQVEVPGSPTDSLTAEWVVLDSTRREVARASGALAPSACDPVERRVADFAADLPPGPYLVGLTVRDASGRRGVVRAVADLARDSSALALSDVVVACGEPGLSVAGGEGIRPAPNPGHRVGDGAPLTAYFEIYHLTPDADGRARFEYVYTVRSAARDPRIWIQRMLSPRSRIPEISATRVEENAGPLRRQFVSVPVQSLPPGPYRLEIRVRDLATRAEVTASADFTRESAAPPSPAPAPPGGS